MFWFFLPTISCTKEKKLFRGIQLSPPPFDPPLVSGVGSGFCDINGAPAVNIREYYGIFMDCSDFSVLLDTVYFIDAINFSGISAP